MAYGHTFRVYSNRIKTYEEALAHEAAVKPIRGKTIKPLHRRRDTHLTIRKQDVWQAALLGQTETVFEGEEVVIQMYNTDIVKYRPNGDIYVQIGGWINMATCQVLTDILGANFNKYDNKMWVKCDIPESYSTYALPIDAHAPNIFRVNTSNTLEFQNYKYPEVHNLNRQKANIVRKQYKSFRQYLTNNFKLRSEDGGVTCTFGADEFLEAFKPDQVYGIPNIPNVRVVGKKWTNEKAVAEYMALITNDGLGHKTEDFYKAVLMTVGAGGGYRRHNAVALKQLLKVLDDCILYHHRDTVFVKKQVTTGAWVIDSYSRFMEQ